LIQEEYQLLLAATSDIHWPRFRELFLESLSQMPSSPSLFLLAGDLVNRGNPQAIHPLTEQLEELNCPIFAIFGNDEYDMIKEELRSITDGIITFLDDEMSIISLNGQQVAIVGTRGVLDQPTFWQSRYVKGIRKRYTRRVKTINTLLTKASAEAEHTILLTHYAPSFVTLGGEMQRALPQMGSRRIEQLLKQHNPTLAIHGHAHYGLKQGLLGTTHIYNVALPLHKKIVLIDFPISRGLENYLIRRPQSSSRRPET
jgi:Icc-related predicted phosphoesterase